MLCFSMHLTMEGQTCHGCTTCDFFFQNIQKLSKLTIFFEDSQNIFKTYKILTKPTIFFKTTLFPKFTKFLQNLQIFFQIYKFIQNRIFFPKFAKFLQNLQIFFKTHNFFSKLTRFAKLIFLNLTKSLHTI